jgi:ABC-2 type transport system permease protein
LTRSSSKTRWDVVRVVAMARLRMMSRYRGWFVLDIIVPTFIAAIPILIGQALAGPDAGQNFETNTGTDNYVAYLLIGSNVFMMVSGALWNFGFWLRREQQTGTLEILYMAPTSRALILAGVALYGTVRNLLNFGMAFTVGCLIFGVNPLQGEIMLALVFLLVGLIPLYGISLLYGAIVLQLREANAMIQLAQWLVSFLMGIFFPIAAFPPLLRALALTFPPTWMNNGVRAALLDVAWFFETWYLDLAVLAAFCAVVPVIGYWIFLGTERRIKANQGVGQF